jgi:hypothetical protein
LARPRAPLALIAIAAAAALGGCAAATTTSSGHFQGQAHAVAQTIDTLSSAASAHDTAKICNSVLASQLVAKLNQAPGGCQRAIGNQLDDADNFDVTVVANGVLVSGQTATAQVKSTVSGHDHVDKLTLVSQGGSWRISGLAS